MKRYKLLSLLLLLSPLSTYANVDIIWCQFFGKVKVAVSTGGYECEDHKKAFMVGELAARLVKKLNYNDTVLLYFNYIHREKESSRYFISFDDGSETDIAGKGVPHGLLTKKALVIREAGPGFNAAAILGLLEYAIKNKTLIKDSQKNIEYQSQYYHWRLTSVDTAIARRVAYSASSTAVKEVLAGRVYRPGTVAKQKDMLSYYFENNKYHVYCNDYDGKTSVLLAVDNINQLEWLSSREAIVFDTDSTFYYVRDYGIAEVSRRWTIKNMPDYHDPYRVAKIGSHKVAISFGYTNRSSEDWFPDERTLIYRIDKDDLVQDLDKKLDHYYFL